jgi:formylglycine-generating enzyme required for sulfatase activity
VRVTLEMANDSPDESAPSMALQSAWGGTQYRVGMRSRRASGVRLLVLWLPLVAPLIGCRPAEPVPTRGPNDLVGVSKAEPAEPTESEDDEADDLRCAEDPEARGCPWERLDESYVDEGVWGNRDPDTGLPERPPPERCPETTVYGDMLEVAAGPFTMGCDEPDSNVCGKAERGARTIDLPAFAIDRTEITQAAYSRCIEAGVCSAPAGGFRPNENCTHPVVNVDWEQASQYCAWQNKRLPSEAEWEKAARGTDGRRYPWGDEVPDCERANFESCGRKVEPVASHPSGASPYGVLDMAGNVREWVFDREAGQSKSPKRAIRGGMFSDPATHLRAVRRTYGDVSVSDLGIGFRCAK